jgi:hypothetical protein
MAEPYYDSRSAILAVPPCRKPVPFQAPRLIHRQAHGQPCTSTTFAPQPSTHHRDGASKPALIRVFSHRPVSMRQIPRSSPICYPDPHDDLSSGEPGQWDTRILALPSGGKRSLRAPLVRGRVFYLCS